MYKFKRNSNSRTPSKPLQIRKKRRGATKSSKGWQKYFEKFQEKLAPQALFIRDVDGDGNCLFRAVADQITGNEENHRHYRKVALKHIKENAKLFTSFMLEDETLDEYLNEMKEDGTWGGHFELAALSNTLNCNFCVHMLEKEPVIIGCSTITSEAKLRTYHLAYNGGHYSSIRKIGDSGSSTAKAINMFQILKSKEEKKLSEDEFGSKEDSSVIMSGTDAPTSNPEKNVGDEESKSVERKEYVWDLSQGTEQASLSKIENDEFIQSSMEDLKLEAKTQIKVISDNAKCPCGSKFKYKKCCKKFADDL